ncbi:lipase family protein [Gordonia sp. JH63]|uniref:alpha/beta hydrolase n=1 Tax=Gordonia sp. JH63 TaxID=2698900 RepID=UPI001EF01D37|nr:lipase family protein [Gordonia sp. JH63]
MRTPRTGRRGIATILLTAAIAVVGCSTAPPEPGTAPVGAGGVEYRVDTEGTSPGALRAAETMPLLDRRVRANSQLALRVRYVSTDGRTGAQTEVWGAFFAPRGPAPAGGRRVIVLPHGTSGVLGECGVTLRSDLGDLAVTAAGWLELGYVVAVPDYQGLGIPGEGRPTHPYLDARTAGRNVIDAVRAARHLVPGTGTSWAALGGSQGGQAAWAANKLARNYGGELDLVGVAALSPASDVSELADLAAREQMTVEQYGLLNWLLLALEWENPQLDLSRFVGPDVLMHWDELSQCSASQGARRAEVLGSLTPENLRPSSPAAVAELRALLRERALPDLPAASPSLVIYGGKDELVLSRWTTAAIRDSCARGDIVHTQFQPAADHGGVDGRQVVGWLTARFDGEASYNRCVETEDAP